MESAREILRVFREAGEINVVRIASILVVAWILLLMDQKLIPRLARKLPGRLRVHLLALVPLLRLTIIVVAIVLVILRLVEPTVENMVVLFAFVGVGVGFAVKDYAASIVAGTVTLYEMPYRPGDWITVDGVYGKVKSLEFRAVHLVTPDDTLVIVPHKRLWDSTIHNANSGTTKLQCVAHFHVSSNHDGPRLRRRLHDVALTSPYVQLAHEPKVVSEQTPWGTHYRVRAYPMDPDQQFTLLTDLTERGNAAIAQLGIEFASAPVAAPTQRA
jgi:small-conductance mechanosensitive channel